MLTLNEIAIRHQEWIKIAVYLGCTQMESEEVVQRMYLKLGEIQQREGHLNRLENYHGQVNTVYLFKVLQNLTIDIKRKDSLITYTDQDQDFLNCPPNVECSEEEYAELIKSVKEVVLTFHAYDQMLIEMHFVYGLSMRQISKETGIPTHSIFNSLKNAKTRIKQATEQVYRNYVRAEADKEAFNGLRRHDSESNSSDWD